MTVHKANKKSTTQRSAKMQLDSYLRQIDQDYKIKDRRKKKQKSENYIIENNEDNLSTFKSMVIWGFIGVVVVLVSFIILR